MQMESEEPRVVPMTGNRALTELVRSRRQIDAARRSLELALEIFDKLEAAPRIPRSSLSQVLGQLEIAEATLWEVAQ